MSQCLSPLNWPGGKTRAFSIIQPFIPKGPDIFSPFFGGGSIEFGAARNGSRVHGYDTYEPLIIFYRQLTRDPDAVLEAALALHPLTDETFELISRNLHLMPDCPKTAASMFALNHTTWMGLTQCGGHSRAHDRFDPVSIRRKLKFDLTNVTVENLDFRESFQRHNDIFAFIDPPYSLRNKKAEKLYGTNGSHHRDFNHDDLFALVKDRKNWIMTHEDHPEIRSRYEDFPMEEVSWRYNLSNRMGHELIIKSREHQECQQAYFTARSQLNQRSVSHGR